MRLSQTTPSARFRVLTLPFVLFIRFFAGSRRPDKSLIPAGSPMAESIHFQYAVHTWRHQRVVVPGCSANRYSVIDGCTDFMQHASRPAPRIHSAGLLPAAPSGKIKSSYEYFRTNR
jgi:hypothetical protein